MQNIAKKIADAVKASEIPPDSFVSLGELLAQVLSPEDLEKLDQLEKDRGSDGANAWLVEVLVGTNLYKTDGAGAVELI